MSYAIKEIFLTLQGEGAHAGRTAVFCRFSGCNLWTGREQDRSEAVCKFCDTDFVGMDGTLGGRYATAGGKTTASGQMFVEYRAPERVTQPYPIVLVHGTAQTGTNFLGTPDGRPGWADRFAAKGFAVYVVDQVGRGRSGGDPDTYGPYARLPAEDLETVFTGQERFALYPQAKLHTQWPGGAGVRGNAAFDQFYLSQVPYIASALKSEELVDPALVALLETIGPAILLTHSQAGVFGWAVSDQRPDLVKEIVVKHGARDTTTRGTAMKELEAMTPRFSQWLPGEEVPEKHWMYRLAKRYWFYDFNAYRDVAHDAEGKARTLRKELVAAS